MKLERSSTTFDMFQCVAAHGTDLPDRFRDLIFKAVKSDWALAQLETFILKSESPEGQEIKAMLGTTQAVDLIQGKCFVGCTVPYLIDLFNAFWSTSAGGVKINALPEEATAVVNHRISTSSSVHALHKHLIDLFEPFTKSHNISLRAFGETIGPLYGLANVTLSEAYGSALEPAPVTPSGNAAWKVFGGTIRSAYEDWAEGKPGEDGKVYVAPMAMNGNTGAFR